MTYARLIAEALNNFPNGASLHPDSIYNAINARHPQYKMENNGWKADVRNNLSINKNFIQEGEYWKLAPIGPPSNRKRTQYETTICDVVILPKISKDSQGYNDSRFEDRSYFDEARNTEKDPLSICDSKMDKKIAVFCQKNLKGSTINCSVCELPFRNEQLLKYHVNSVHKRIDRIKSIISDPFQCTHCSFNCSSFSGVSKLDRELYLKSHIESRHQSKMKNAAF
jgi:hypothetical protein